MTDVRQIQAYLDFRLGKLSRHGLVDYAMELHKEEQVPAWARDLASLFPKDILDADRVLEDQLTKAGILPGSVIYLQQIRDRILECSDKLEGSEDLLFGELMRTIKDLLKLVGRGYEEPLSIPILEYGCDPANSLTNKSELQSYLRRNVGHILGV